MMVLASRFRRLISMDPTLPLQCYTKWGLHDATVECHCKEKCIYRKFSFKNWVDYSNETCKGYIEKNSDMSKTK